MLTREDVIAVASRLFAVYLLVVALNAGAQWFAPLFMQDQSVGWIVVLATFFVALLVIAALLWFFPLTIARKLFPVARDSASSPPVARDPELPTLAFSVLGAWVLASALADGVYWVMFFAAAARMNYNYSLTPDQIANMIATVAELAIGIYLLFGSRGLSSLLYRFRYGRT